MYELSRHKRLDFRLPTSWNNCTVAELETIARVFIDCQQRTTSLRHFSMEDVKVALFFALTGIVIIEPLNPRVKVEDQYYVCRDAKGKTVFNLYLWQINDWVFGLEGCKGLEGHKGILDWVDNPKSEGLILFPYNIYKVRKNVFSFAKKFEGPGAIAQNATWQQFRFAQDYMDLYIKQSNILLSQMQKGGNDAELMKQAKLTDLAKSMFLATIFCAKHTVIDEITKVKTARYVYVSNQHSDNAIYFRNFPEVQWQVILLWWSGLMKYLQRHFPHCFKVQKVKRVSNPLEIYTRTAATIEKHIGITDDAMNREPYQNILQHLEDMARENEELEKIKRK